MPLLRCRAGSITTVGEYATNKDKLSCSVCQREFNRNRKADLDRHMRVHTGEKPYKCTFPGCTSSFSQSQAAKNHMNKHTGKKPYRCEHCSSTFYDKPTANRHKREKHGPEIVYQCKHCNRSFKRKSVYKQHVQSEHSYTISDDEATKHRVMGGSSDVESPTSGAGSPVNMNTLYPFNTPEFPSAYTPSGYAIPDPSTIRDVWTYNGYPDATSAYPTTTTIQAQPSYEPVGTWGSPYAQEGTQLYSFYPVVASQRQSPRSVHHTPTSSQSSISSSSQNRSPVPYHHTSPSGSPIQVPLSNTDPTTYANSYYRDHTPIAYNHACYQ